MFIVSLPRLEVFFSMTVISQKYRNNFNKTHLLFLHRFKDLDNTFFIVGDIYTFKDLTVFSSANLPNNLVVILITEQEKILSKN